MGLRSKNARMREEARYHEAAASSGVSVGLENCPHVVLVLVPIVEVASLLDSGRRKEPKERSLDHHTGFVK